MIEAAVNERDRAIIAIGYEAGLRIGELASLIWGNVIWTE
jgi:integrase